jgi:hypothetical protein
LCDDIKGRAIDDGKKSDNVTERDALNSWLDIIEENFSIKLWSHTLAEPW